MSVGTARRIQTVTVDLANGEQVRLDDSDRVYDQEGRTIPLSAVPDTLNDPAAWIEYETEAQWRQGEDREPWMDEVEPWYIARSRVWARGVVHCMTIYRDAAA